MVADTILMQNNLSEYLQLLSIFCRSCTHFAEHSISYHSACWTCHVIQPLSRIPWVLPIPYPPYLAFNRHTACLSSNFKTYHCPQWAQKLRTAWYTLRIRLISQDVGSPGYFLILVGYVMSEFVVDIVWVNEKCNDILGRCHRIFGIPGFLYPRT